MPPNRIQEDDAELRHTAVGQSWLRDTNLAAVTKALFASPHEVSRVELAEITNLTRATVSRLVDQLISAGIAEMLPPVRLPQQGRPAAPIRPASGKVVAIGLEIGVSYIAGRAIDITGKALSEFEVAGDFAKSDPEQTVGLLTDMAVATMRGLTLSGASIAGISLAVPAVVSSPGGHLLLAPNLGWEDVPLLTLLRRGLEEFSDLPLLVDNDASLQSTLAAHVRPGLLIENPTFLYLIGDRGIGGAIVLDGLTYSGESGWAGEIGHMCVEPDGIDCFCGSSGCLERYADLTALLTNAGLDPKRDTVDTLIDRLKAGDREAAAAIRIAVRALSVALANTVNLLDISSIVLGPTLGQLLPWLEPSLSDQTNKMVLGSKSHRTHIRGAQQTTLPACTGGAFAMLRGVLEDPGAWVAAT